MGFGGPHAGFMATGVEPGPGPARPPRRGVDRRRGPHRPTGSPSRPGSSTSAGRRRRRTSARPRCSWPTWPPPTPPGTGPDGLVGDRRPGSTGWPRRFASGTAGHRALTRQRQSFVDTAHGLGPGSGPMSLAAAARRSRAEHPASRRRRPRLGLSFDETSTDGHWWSRCWSTCSEPRPTRRSPWPPAVASAVRRPRAGSELPASERRTVVVPAPTRTSTATAPSTRCSDGYAASPIGRSRARPHDDPARQLHDETQRGGRDGADLVARVGPRAPLRPRRPRRPATVRDDRPSSSDMLTDITGYDQGVDPAQRRQPG